MENLNNIKYNLEELFFSKYDDITPFEKIIDYCDNCSGCPKGRCLFVYPKTARLDTMYEDEKSNYFTGCDLIEKINSSYKEMWEEYYSSR